MPSLDLDGVSLPTNNDNIRVDGTNIRELRVDSTTIWLRDSPPPVTGRINFNLNTSGLSNVTATISPSSSTGNVGSSVGATITAVAGGGGSFGSSNNVTVPGFTSVLGADGRIRINVSAAVTSTATRTVTFSPTGSVQAASGIVSFSRSGTISGATVSLRDSNVSVPINNSAQTVITFTPSSGRAFTSTNNVSLAVTNGDFDSLSLNNNGTITARIVSNTVTSTSGLSTTVFFSGSTSQSLIDVNYSINQSGLTNATASLSSAGAEVSPGTVVNTLVTITANSGFTFNGSAAGRNISVSSGASISNFRESGGNLVAVVSHIASASTNPFNGVITVTGTAAMASTNNPPVINSITADNGISVLGRNSNNVGLRASVSDADGDGLTYSWTTSGPLTVVAGANSSSVTVRSINSVGTGTVTLTVNDGNGGSDTETYSIRVVNNLSIVLSNNSGTIEGSGITANFTVSPSDESIIVRGGTWTNGAPFRFENPVVSTFGRGSVRILEPIGGTDVSVNQATLRISISGNRTVFDEFQVSSISL